MGYRSISLTHSGDVKDTVARFVKDMSPSSKYDLVSITITRQGKSGGFYVPTAIDMLWEDTETGRCYREQADI